MQKPENLINLAIGLTLFAVCLVLSEKLPHPTDVAQLIFRLLAALGAAFAATAIPGTIGVDLPLGVKAGGALGVFVLVLFVKPPSLIAINPASVDPNPNPQVKEPSKGEEPKVPADNKSRIHPAKPSLLPMNVAAMRGDSGTQGSGDSSASSGTVVIAPRHAVQTTPGGFATLPGNWLGTLSWNGDPNLYRLGLHVEANDSHGFAATTDDVTHQAAGLGTELFTNAPDTVHILVTQTYPNPPATFTCSLHQNRLPCSVDQGPLHGSITFQRQ